MTDSLGHRKKFAVLIPPTNTSMRPEFDAMRPLGVTNLISRIIIPNIALKDDAAFNRLIAAAQNGTVDAAMSCAPDRPLPAINTAIYWHALRESGSTDRIAGFGALLRRH